jgi:hypothetical protein
MTSETRGRLWLFSTLLISICIGCHSEPNSGADSGPGLEIDSAISPPVDLSEAMAPDSVPPIDQGRTVDLPPEDSPSIPVADFGPDSATPFSQCGGICAQQNLKASFGSATVPFERAIYGLEKNAQGKWSIYIEALHGGFSGCPQQNSPSPDRTLIITGIPLPTGPTTLTHTQGLSVTLLDFEGSLISLPVAKATSIQVSVVAANVCTACVGQAPPADIDGFVALDLQATFAEGTVSGHLYAEHCDSLDL